ncbi:MAG: HAD family hydrolase [Peptococcaceae bacterium]|nr:HAD family hydrolase [Peptococcaceae bacterium]
MIKGALFDMDGTLSNTIPYWNKIIPDYIRSTGNEPDMDVATDNIHAMSLSDSAVYIRDYFHLSQSAEEIVNAWRASANRIYTEVAPLKDGAYDFLKRLQGLGIPMLLVTNNDKALAEALLKRTGVLDCFQDLYCGYNMGLGKTEPTMIELARKALGTAPEDTWMFEDSIGPIRTAKSVGIHTVAMVDPYHDPAEIALVRDEAEHVFDSYAQADAWLDTMLR